MATVRIRIEGARQLSFDVQDDDGTRLATSLPFDSICRLEAALGTLSAASREPWHIAVEAASTTVVVGSARRRVRLMGRVAGERVRTVLAAVAKASIADERPVGRRRQDLTGLNCDLSR